MQDTLLKLISFGALVTISISIIFIILNLLGLVKSVKKIIVTYRSNIIFLVSLGGTVGSILLSVYFKLAPCELCWYQRMFLFCIPVITLVSILKKQTNVHLYAFWLSVIGLCIAFYHSLLQLNIFSSDSVFCSPTSAVDCAIAAFTYFGFVTIPVISFSVFLLLVMLSYDYKKF